MYTRIPDGITKQDVEQAIEDFLAGVNHEFAPSTGYDLVHDDQRLPPKAILGLAARRLNGGQPLHPYDFSGGDSSKCFRVLRNLGYVIEPKPGKSNPHGIEMNTDQRPWSDAELIATVEAYIWMQGKERAGEQYFKATVNRALREGPLADRSKGSVEYRMQNISAVLEELGCAWINGYKPSRNVGASVRKRIQDMLAKIGAVSPGDFEPTADQQELDSRTDTLLERGIAVKPKGTHDPVASESATVRYARSPAVKAWALQRAHGTCEMCEQPAPFENQAGVPFLEVHHIVRLRDGGPDTPENVAALCPNCHRRLHHGGDREQMATSLKGRIEALERQVPGAARPFVNNAHSSPMRKS
jgi:5-methylcytosine-specific restriction protein A